MLGFGWHEEAMQHHGAVYATPGGPQGSLCDVWREGGHSGRTRRLCTAGQRVSGVHTASLSMQCWPHLADGGCQWLQAAKAMHLLACPQLNVQDKSCNQCCAGKAAVVDGADVCPWATP